MGKSRRIQELDDFVFDSAPARHNRYQVDDDDLDSLDGEEGVTDIIVQKYKEDIAEILSQAYNDVTAKVDQIAEALQPGK